MKLRREDDSGTVGKGTQVVGIHFLQKKDGDGNVEDTGYDSGYFPEYGRRRESLDKTGIIYEDNVFEDG